MIDLNTPRNSYTAHCFADEYGQQDLLEDIQSVDFIVAHNAKFEVQWLRRCGQDLTKLKVYCTMLGQWVLNGNRKKSLKLEDVGREYGFTVGKDSYVSDLIKRGVCPSDIPRGKLLKYCKQDVALCGGIFVWQKAKLRDQFQLHLALTRNLTCVVLADIEFNGMTLDPERVKKEYRDAILELNTLKIGLAERAPGVNLNSGKQLAEFLYDKLGFPEPRDHKGQPIRTATGRRSTDTGTLSLLHPTTTEQLAFLTLYVRFNKVSSMLQKNLEFFKGVVDTREDNNFKAQFNQGITSTHRLSSNGRPLLFPSQTKPKSVQFQNLPRDYKKLFWAGSEEDVIGEVDGAALEFRVAADMGRDRTAIQEIEEWVDVHEITARTLTKAGEPTNRQVAKASTFAPLYAGMGKTPAQKAYSEFFKKKYDGISTMQKDWSLKVLDNKELTTPYGMRFYWPECKMSRSGYIEKSTEIYNFPIQSAATAEIIPIALVHLWYRLKSYDSGITIINTVHDSIICKFNKSKEEEFRNHSTQALTTDVYTFLKNNYHYEFQAPLGVGIKVSRNWGDTKLETKTNVWPDGRMEMKDG